jgi:hypothetical protein
MRFPPLLSLFPENLKESKKRSLGSNPKESESFSKTLKNNESISAYIL